MKAALFGALMILVQIVVAMLVAGAVMPGILFALPARQVDSIGRPLVFAVPIVLFVLLRLVWPKRFR